MLCSVVLVEAKSFGTHSAKRSTTSLSTDDDINGCRITKVSAEPFIALLQRDAQQISLYTTTILSVCPYVTFVQCV